MCNENIQNYTVAAFQCYIFLWPLQFALSFFSVNYCIVCELFIFIVIQLQHCLLMMYMYLSRQCVLNTGISEGYTLYYIDLCCIKYVKVVCQMLSLCFCTVGLDFSYCLDSVLVNSINRMGCGSSFSEELYIR